MMISFLLIKLFATCCFIDLDFLFVYSYLFLNLNSNYFIFFFFFSSRRRHTRCSRDWSSDVCSSDLTNSSRRSSITQSVAPERFAFSTSPVSSPAPCPTSAAKHTTRAPYCSRSHGTIDRKSVV